MTQSQGSKAPSPETLVLMFSGALMLLVEGIVGCLLMVSIEFNCGCMR